MSDATQSFLFDDLGSRKVQADFGGGHLSGDGGVLLLRQMNRSLGLTRRLARCFRDTRDPRLVEHSVEELLAQRIYALALGYEDLNDHGRLRRDHLLAVACEKRDPLGENRLHPQHRGVALAASATLNRLEMSNSRATRAHRLSHAPDEVGECLLEFGTRCLPREAREVVLDLDAMGHRIHGTQEGRHFSGYYDDYCYLPLYVFAGDFPLWAELRTCERSAAHGAVDALRQIVAAIRKRCPEARIIVRGDSGFGTEEIMAWSEAQEDVFYCLGFARNSVLVEMSGPAFAVARARHCLSGASTRAFADLQYRTKSSWSRQRRVVAKAEVGPKGDNPRFVVTNLPEEGFADDADRNRFSASRLYEECYCARGEMENVLKQQVLDLQADRMSTHHLASNQLRLWLTTFAYLLMERVRALGCQGSQLAQATVGSLRLKLLKVAAHVKVSARRVHVQLSSAFPLRELFLLCARRLSAAADPTG